MYTSMYNLVFDINQPGREGEKLIFNPLSRSLDLVSVKVLRLLGEPGCQTEGRPGTRLIDHLVQRGYLYRFQENEDRRIQQEYEKSNALLEHEPIQFSMLPTYACNLRCTYCYQQYTTGYEHVSMSDEMVEKAAQFVLQKVMEAGMKRSPYITLFGGEPLLPGKNHRRLIEKILGVAKQYQVPIHIVTSGVTLKSYLDVFEGAMIIEIDVSLDGPKEVNDRRRKLVGGQGSFDKAMEGIQAAIDRNIPVAIRAVVDRKTVESFPELVEDFHRRGWTDLPREQFRIVFQHNQDVLLGDLAAEPQLVQLGEGGHGNGQTPAQGGRPLVPRQVSNAASYRKYWQDRLQIQRWLCEVAATNELTWEMLQPDCKGVKYIYDHGEGPPPVFYCPASNNTWELDPYGEIYTCLACAGNREGHSRIGRYYPEIEIDQERLSGWKKKNVFDVPKCVGCEVRFACGSGCSSLADANTPLEPTCEPVYELMQIGFDHYFPKLEQRWLDAPVVQA